MQLAHSLLTILLTTLPFLLLLSPSSANPNPIHLIQKRNGNFQQTCPYHFLQYTLGEAGRLWGARGDSVDVLVGFCNVSGKWGAWRVSKLKLKRCIENRDGKMVYAVSDDRKGSTFGRTCKDCELVGWTGELRCQCQRDAVDPQGIHMPVSSSIMLSDFVWNDEGVLSCA